MIQEGTEFIDLENEETAETVLPDNQNDPVPAETDYSDNFSTAQVVEPEAQASDMCYNVASLFVISMIVGLLVFHILSRRWT